MTRHADRGAQDNLSAAAQSADEARTLEARASELLQRLAQFSLADRRDSS